jgi:hypothetical protein
MNSAKFCYYDGLRPQQYLSYLPPGRSLRSDAGRSREQANCQYGQQPTDPRQGASGPSKWQPVVSNITASVYTNLAPLHQSDCNRVSFETSPLSLKRRLRKWQQLKTLGRSRYKYRAAASLRRLQRLDNEKIRRTVRTASAQRMSHCISL